ncbi:MAG: adenylate kinase [Salinivirgaceae bacterium]|nr:adenylate kinase [Salinivirgaceae bacterium]MDD4745665.1 adenylate kinase [Salinivirgaceae bacterium]MDY0279313.1 adenylate kinase [Salinivirgaceae bacterium]
MLNIALFGPPGAGKGTQSQWLIEKYNLTYISTGEILREEILAGTKLGLMAKNIIEKGGLASDEIIVQIIENKITKNPDANGFLFDGFPRTIVQCYILDGLLMKMNTSLTCMLSLEVPEDELIRRLRERAKISNRKDDNEVVIQVRLKEYYEKTVPVSTYYMDKNIYFPVDGTGEIQTIQNRLYKAVEKSLENQWENIILFGYPGSGKGSQAKKMAEKFNLVYISTGSLLRKEIKLETEIGKLAKPYMDKGSIVPDEYAIKLIEKIIHENPNSRGFIFKGFPRTIVQAYIVEGMLRRLNSTITGAIEIKVSPLEAVRRLALRSKTEKSRLYDMDTELIVSRLQEYEDKTVLARDFYEKKNLLYVVDGEGTEDEVFERISDQLERMKRRTV